MRQESLIVKLSAPCVREKPVVNNVFGELDAKNFAKLVDAADLKANPRDCKIGGITDDIIDSLLENPVLFEHKQRAF